MTIIQIQIDSEKTNPEALVEFNKDIFKEVPEVSPLNRRHELTASDPGLSQQVAEATYFVLKEIGPEAVLTYLAARWSNSDSGQQKVVQTGDGTVYIEDVNVLSDDEAEELFEEDH